MPIYIAGPMTGIPNFNYPLFNKVAEYLRYKGHEVINPAENFDGDQTLAHEVYLRKALQQVADCTHMVLIPGWERSRGAVCEVHAALMLGLEFMDVTLVGFGVAVIDSPQPPTYADVTAAMGALYPRPVSPAPAESVFQEANRLVNGDRGAAYGHPYDDYKKTSKMWTGVLVHKLLPGAEITPAEAVIMMKLLKMSRELNKPKRDNLVDDAGYSLCLEKIYDKERELGLRK